MLTCRDASHLLSEKLDRPLGVRERIGLRLHLMMCDGCTNLERQWGLLRRFARAYRGGSLPPGDAPPDRHPPGS